MLRETLLVRREDYLSRLLELVSADTSVVGHGIDGGGEETGQIILERVMREMGAETSREPLTEEIVQEGLRRFGEGNPGHVYSGDGFSRWNLVGRFRGGGGRSIMFDGHVDTMPSGPRELWSFDPHDAHVRDGRVCGLGSTDMKGGLMASLMAVKLLQESGIPLPGDVTILSVVDEEGGGNGSLAAMLAGHRADAAVVCEPSDGSVTIAHMGFVFFKVEVRGVALHSGSKWKGVNAIEKAVLLMQALNDMEHEWLMKYRHPMLPPPTLNVGVIEGGTAGSTVPDRCVFKLCLHYHPGTMTHESVVRETTERLLLRAAGDPWLKDNPPEISIYQAGGAFEMDAGHPFVTAVESSIEASRGRRPPVVGSPAGNDARLLRNIGGMPVVITGPGNQEQCHSPDEYLELEEYFRYIEIYARLILEWCGREEEDGR